MITAEVIEREFIVEVSARNEVMLCDDATAILMNTLGQTLSTTNIPSGDTAIITAPNGVTTIENSARTVLVVSSVPSGRGAVQTISNSLITLRNTLNTTLNTYSIPATVNDIIIAPDGTATITVNGTPYTYNVASGAVVTDTITIVCPTLTDLINSSTAAQIKAALDSTGKSTPVQTLLLEDYGAGFLAGKQFGSLTTSVTGIRVFGNTAFVCNGTANTVVRYNATTNVVSGTGMGYTRAFKISFKSDGGYAVTNFTGNTVRILNAANNQTAIFSVITNPSAIEWNIAEDLVYVAPFAGTGTITKYNLSGVSQGTVTGFQTNIIAIVKVALEYWVLSTDNSSNQTIRKMLFSNDTQTGLLTLEAASVAGIVRDMVVTTDRIYVVTDSNQIREYNHAGTLQRGDHIGAAGTFGMCQNPNRRKNLLSTSSTLGTIINIIHP